MSVGRVQRGRAAVAEPSIAMPERCGIRDCAGKRDIQHAPGRGSEFGVRTGGRDRRRAMSMSCRRVRDRTGRVALDGTL